MKYNKGFLKIMIIIIVTICSISIVFICFNDKKIERYNLTDVKKAKDSDITSSDSDMISLKNDEKIYFENEISFISNIETDSNYYIQVKINDDIEKLTFKDINDEKVLKNKLKEGNNSINIKIFLNDKLNNEINKNIFYIKPYNHQFIESLSNSGIHVHYKNGNFERYDKSSNLLIALGSQNIRAEILQYAIKDSNDMYSNFKDVDQWIDDLNKKSNINILLLLGCNIQDNKYKQVSNDDEYNNYIAYLDAIIEHYPNSNNIEIMNEVNINQGWVNKLNNENEYNYYIKILNYANSKYELNILPAGTATFYNSNYGESSEQFYDRLLKKEKKINNINIHPYSSNLDELRKKVNSNWKIAKQYGGFINLNATEYGCTTFYMSEDEQSMELVKQSVCLSGIMKNYILYNLWDTSSKDEKSNQKYGIIDNEYIPKKSYYSMKNYYENTNGSEYIGQVNIVDGLEAHVYDKDGKPKIIVWATDKNKPITINSSGYIAKDLYGHDIENTDGTLEITSSPIYLDNVPTKFYYEAISNSIKSGYSEFNTKFANEISKVEGLSNKISSLSSYAATLSNMSTLNEDVANAKIKEHFDLGNMIINAYKNGKLDVEYVKLSSMLDYLNTIGNSYEDLITVSAKSRITDLTDITNEVNEAKALAEDTVNTDIVYPNKIYKFAQDLLDTSSYILGLEEENDIKTGLINSKAIHAKYLAEWSKEFSGIYIRDAYKDSVDSIKQQNEDFKNKNSNIYKNTNISNAYNDLINGLDNIMQNPEQTNMDGVDEIYNKQFILIYQIVNEYNEKKIDINVDQYKALINDLIDTSENYRKLYNLFYKNEDISTDDLTQKLNTVIERYNYNLDADLSDVTNLINKTKDIYNNSIGVDNSSDNYLNKLKVHKSCVIIANILENDIKTKADEESKNVKVKYNIKTPTNQNVTAEIRLPSDKCSIENNPNNEIYTFTENKTQEITIKIRGYKYGYYIQINNIDKIPPKITGVEDKGQYEGKVTPKVTDENLSEIKLIKDGQTVESYKANMSITQEGIYQLIAKDKAGNETTINFIIAYPEEEKYRIENYTIKNINGETEKSKLKERLQISGEYKIKRNNKELNDTDYISTGDILELKSGEKYTLIVKGDVNKDGEVSIKDIVRLRKYLLGNTEFGDIEKIAADANLDGKEIGIKDLVRMRILALTREN